MDVFRNIARLLIKYQSSSVTVGCDNVRAVTSRPRKAVNAVNAVNAVKLRGR
jgi:hypothetical protein